MTRTDAATAVSPERVFRVAALAEAVTWTLLLGGILLRALDPALAVAVSIGGALHGLVFLAYAATAVLVGVDRRWRAPLQAVAVLAAVVPYATVLLERRLRRTGRLGGGWRTVDDGGDRTPLDALVRALVRRPALLIGGGALVVAAVFAVLLLLGPPGR